MTHCIYDKTIMGREEITSRKNQLSSRLRSLLVLIDGKQSESALLVKINALGLDKVHLQKLLDQGYIQVVDAEKNNLTDVNNAKAEIEIDFTFEEINSVLEESQTIFQEPVHEDISVINTTTTEMRIQLRIEILRKFVLESINEYLGLRGFFISQKTKKAKNFEDFHSIRNKFVVAILRKKGRDKAIELRDEFDQMLYSRFSPDFPEFLDD